MSASSLYPIKHTVLVGYDSLEGGHIEVGEVTVYADAECDCDQIAASAYAALAEKGRFTIKGTDASYTVEDCKEFLA